MPHCDQICAFQFFFGSICAKKNFICPVAHRDQSCMLPFSSSFVSGHFACFIFVHLFAIHFEPNGSSIESWTWEKYPSKPCIRRWRWFFGGCISLTYCKRVDLVEPRKQHGGSRPGRATNLSRDRDWFTPLHTAPDFSAGPFTLLLQFHWHVNANMIDVQSPYMSLIFQQFQQRRLWCD